jgi:SHS2 domain-containing protein
MGDAWEWRTTEHTADLAIEVEARTLELLFEAAAHAMTGVLLGAEAGPSSEGARRPSVWRDLQLEAEDRDALLIDWLRELLYIH